MVPAPIYYMPLSGAVLKKQSALNEYNTKITNNFALIKGLTSPVPTELKASMLHNQSILNSYNDLMNGNFLLVSNSDPGILPVILKVGTFNNQSALNDYYNRVLYNFQLIVYSLGPQ